MTKAAAGRFVGRAGSMLGDVLGKRSGAAYARPSVYRASPRHNDSTALSRKHRKFSTDHSPNTCYAYMLLLDQMHVPERSLSALPTRLSTSLREMEQHCETHLG